MRAMISYDIEFNGRMYHILVPNASPYDDARAVLAQASQALDKEQAEKIAQAEAQKQADQQVAQDVIPEVV